MRLCTGGCWREDDGIRSRTTFRRDVEDQNSLCWAIERFHRRSPCSICSCRTSLVRNGVSLAFSNAIRSWPTAWNVWIMLWGLFGVLNWSPPTLFANAVRQRLPRGNEAVGQGDALPGHASLRETERPPKYTLEAKTCIRGVKFARNKGSLPFAAPSCMCFFDASDVLQRGTDMGFLGSQCGHWGVVAHGKVQRVPHYAAPAPSGLAFVSTQQLNPT